MMTLEISTYNSLIEERDTRTYERDEANSKIERLEKKEKIKDAQIDILLKTNRICTNILEKACSIETPEKENLFKKNIVYLFDKFKEIVVKITDLSSKDVNEGLNSIYNCSIEILEFIKNHSGEIFATAMMTIVVTGGVFLAVNFLATILSSSYVFPSVMVLDFSPYAQWIYI